MRVGMERGRGANAKSVCRLVGSDTAKQSIDASWYTEYINDSCVPSPDNDLEGHVLGIDFDGVDGVSKQCSEASAKACAARTEIKCINDVQCELSVMQVCLSVCKVTHLLRAAGPGINVETLREHDVHLSNSLNDLLGCELCNSSCDQTTCGVRGGGLGLRRAADLVLPTLIASRVDSRVAVVSLIDEMFDDDLGELFTTTFDDGVKSAVRELKSRLSDGRATEIHTCLSEARERSSRNDLSIPVTKGDNLISPAAFVDPDEDNTTQGSLCAIVDRDIMDNSLEFHAQANSEPDVRRLRELSDDSTSHDWVFCVNPMYGPVLERDLYLTAIKLRLSASFFDNPFLCPKCRTLG